MCKTFREQRTQRAINQATQQCLCFAGTSFATEKVAGYLAGGITLFLVVHRHRKEVATFHCILVANHRCKHLCLAHADDDCATLARDLAGFHRDRLVTVLKGFLDCTHRRSPLFV